MTFREKLSIEHPECMGDIWDGGCKDCPHSYGYDKSENRICDDKTINNDICKKCWNREYPGEPTEQEKMILDLRKTVDALNNELGVYKFTKNAVYKLECELSCLKRALKKVIEHIDPDSIFAPWEYSYATEAFLKNKFDEIKFSRRRWIGAFIGLSIGFIAFVIRYAIGG